MPPPLRFLDACRGLPTPVRPVWFMRQAGRSLPEYRAARGAGDILSAVRDPALAAELTLQPVRRHGVDAAILFSDIMVPFAAIGAGVEIVAGRGPVVAEPIRTRADVAKLRALEPEVDVPYVVEAARLARDELDSLGVPLIGFAGAPFTVASYLVEGGPSRTYAATKCMMRDSPVLWAELTDTLADISLAFLDAQIGGGAQAVQLFDSWAGALSPDDYRSYALPASKRILAGLAGRDVPRIHFGVGTGSLLEEMAEAGGDVVGVDWRTPLDEARRRLGPSVAVQGNLDPTVCLSTTDIVEKEVHRVLVSAGGQPGHVFNLGHGVLPETDPDVLTRIVEWVHAFDAASVAWDSVARPGAATRPRPM